MRLTDDLKAKLNNAKSEAEVKAILDEIKGGVKDAGLELTDAELEKVAGGLPRKITRVY